MAFLSATRHGSKPPTLVVFDVSQVVLLEELIETRGGHVLCNPDGSAKTSGTMVTLRTGDKIAVADTPRAIIKAMLIDGGRDPEDVTPALLDQITMKEA